MNARLPQFAADAAAFTSGNPAPYETPAKALERINGRTAILKEIGKDIAAISGRVPMATSTFNDDDLYVYVAATKQFVRQIVCKDQEAKDAKYIGVKVMAGQTWATGMTAKTLSLWKPAKATASTTDAGVVG